MPQTEAPQQTDEGQEQPLNPFDARLQDYRDWLSEEDSPITEINISTWMEHIQAAFLQTQVQENVEITPEQTQIMFLALSGLVNEARLEAGDRGARSENPAELATLQLSFFDMATPPLPTNISFTTLTESEPPC